MSQTLLAAILDLQIVLCKYNNTHQTTFQYYRAPYGDKSEGQMVPTTIENVFWGGLKKQNHVIIEGNGVRKNRRSISSRSKFKVHTLCQKRIF